MSQYAKVQVDRELTHIRETHDANATLLLSGLYILSAFIVIVSIGMTFVGYFTVIRPSKKTVQEMRSLLHELPGKIQREIAADREDRLARDIGDLLSGSPAESFRALASISRMHESEFSEGNLRNLLDGLRTLPATHLPEMASFLSTFKNPRVLAALENLLEDPRNAQDYRLINIVLPYLQAQEGDKRVVSALHRALSNVPGITIVPAAYNALRTRPSAVYAIFDDARLMNSLDAGQKATLRQWATGEKSGSGWSNGNSLLTVNELNKTLLFQTVPADSIIGPDGEPITST